MTHYKLSRTLADHLGDVRGVIFPIPDLIASVSRDRTLRVWKHLPGSKATKYGVEWTSTVNYESTEYLNSICWIDDQALIASAGISKEIIVSSPAANTAPEYILKGHEGNVCALNYASGVLVSGSWDRTARIWEGTTCKYVLRGHESAVWAVLALSSDSFLTGSADKTIRLWHGAKSVATFRGHSDVVRSLCRLGEDRIASSSNDGCIRVWDLKGYCVAELYGHTSFVYSLAYSPSTGELVSSGEDRSVRVWKDGECVQTLSLPCTSVWTVAVCPETGDIAAGGSDKTIRVFSRNESYWATREEISKFEEQVAGYAISSAEAGGINKEKLPGAEALQTPGSKIGQVIMIRTGLSGVDAYQWNGDGWTKIGEVVSAVGNRQKQIFDGKEYDYVFDVDIKEGAPPLKLPYNANENPYNAARRFLESNELPLEYLDETAKFIESNTAGVQIGQSQEPVEDPYGSRYVPKNESVASSSQNPAPPAKRSKSTLFPQKTFLSIKKFNAAGLLKKIREFNGAKARDESISGEQLDIVAQLLATVEQKLTAKDAIDLASLGLLIVEKWSPAEKLCGLDILRAIIGQIDDISVVERIIGTVVSSDGIFDVPNNAMMAVRLFANAFESDIGRATIEHSKIREAVLDRIRELSTGSISGPAAIAIATLLLNFSVEVVQQNNLEVAFSIIGVVTEFLQLVIDVEASYRMVIAFGTILSVGSAELVEAGNSLDGVHIIETVKERSGSEKRMQIACDDVYALLK